MDKAHPLKISVQVRSLEVQKDIFWPLDDNEKLLNPEMPYLSAIGALLYLANKRPDIAFSVNLLARYNSFPTKKHWNGIKHIFRYLWETIDRKLFYSNTSKFDLVGFTDYWYLSDPQKTRSETEYLFTFGETVIFWL